MEQGSHMMAGDDMHLMEMGSSAQPNAQAHSNNMKPRYVGSIIAIEDPESPQNWPLALKLYTTSASFLFTFVL